MPRNLDVAPVRAFLAVVDSGGVTSAASLLGLSQAAVSQQIKRLEEALGCRLFERQGRRLVLGPAGERLLARARRLVAQNDELVSAMRAPAFEGEVRFGVPYDIIASFVPPILRRFAKAQPRVRVSLVCEVSRLEPVYAAIEAGLAVAPLLRSSVPERFEILDTMRGGREARLPALPEFRINLYTPPNMSPATRDLADHVRASFSGKFHNN